MAEDYTIPLKSVFSKPKRGRAKAAINAIRKFIKKHKRLEGSQFSISKEVNEKVWENGMFGIPRKIEVQLKEINEKTFVFLKGGKELKEMEKQAKEKKKETKKEETKEEKADDAEKEKEKIRKLEEKRQKELNAEKAEFKRKQKE
ncbi:MAG: 50S ribosomal protein L31e [archaeon]